MHALIYSGTTEEWKQSNLVQDLLANDVLKVYGMRRNGEKVKRYYQPNNDALKAFQRRKDKGMTVSQKVWNQSYNFKRELEYAISSGIEKGQSAVTLSKRISKYLRDFPSLQADYKERYGGAVDCNDCEYRSIRLARSEINMAYREAEQTRWEQMDFIKGYRIQLSGSHPRHDVCDDLAGDYPKWFKWLGWHPNCFCICIPIVMSDDEWYSGKGRQIEDFPPQFDRWIVENEERITKAQRKGTLPYWIKDNYDVISVIKNQAPSYSTEVSSTTGEVVKKEIDISSQDFKEQKERTNVVVRSKRKYNSYDENWDKIYFDEESGGFNVAHVRHQFSDTKAPGAKMTGGEAERFVGEILARSQSKQIEFLPENGNSEGKPDLFFDNSTWDVKYISMANENTIRKYIEDARKANCAIFYWDEDNKLDKLKSAISRTIGKFKKNGELESIPNVYYLNNDNELVCIYKRASGTPK